jgi:hypothetical protein
VRSVSLLIEDYGDIRVLARGGEAANGVKLKEIDEAIITLGFVEIQSRGRWARLRLCPESVAPIAFGRMMEWLIEAKIERFVLCCYQYGGWESRILPLCKTSLHQLAGLVMEAKKAARGGDVRVRSIAAERTPAGPLQHALDFWRMTSGRWDAAATGLFFRRALADRYALYECRSDREFIFRDVGSGMPACALAALRASIGCRIEQLPDGAYGQSCAESYERSTTQGVPGLQDVDALVWWPQHGRLRRRYKRLLLPFRAAGHERLLLCVTAEDLAIDLRTAVA